MAKGGYKLYTPCKGWGQIAPPLIQILRAARIVKHNGYP
jgi:hypothetical protein